jgi:hypothetical protein
MYLYDDGFSADKQIHYRFTGFVSRMLAGLSVWNRVVLGSSCINRAKAEVLSSVIYSAIVGIFLFGKTQIVS